MTLYDEHQVPEDEVVDLLRKWDVPAKRLAPDQEFLHKLQAQRTTVRLLPKEGGSWTLTRWLAAAVLTAALIPAGQSLLHESSPMEVPNFQASAAADEAWQAMAYDPLDPSDPDQAQYMAALLSGGQVSDDTSLFMQPGQGNSHTGTTPPGHSKP